MVGLAALGPPDHLKQPRFGVAKPMSPLFIGAIVFACVVGGMLFGMVLRAVLPEQHLSAESKDVVKLGMGLIGTMTALVLSLMIASAKSSFDTQRLGVSQLAGNIIMLDRELAHYGPESHDARTMLHDSVADLVARTWPGESGAAQPAARGTEGRYEGLYEKLQELKPKDDNQRTMQAQVLKTAADTAQLRWSLFAQKGSSIPMPFLVLMVSWLVVLIASFSLFAPPNPTVVATLLICALAVSSAVFLILELDQPFGGVISISGDSMRAALTMLGR
jgi:hypothetical protein